MNNDATPLNRAAGENAMSIPIVVGVTGHRDLREQDIPTLRVFVRAELQKLKDANQHSHLIMLNALAAGADLLCAEVALEAGIALIAPLPMPVEEYRQDFMDADLIRLDAALNKAKEVFIVPAIEPCPEPVSREFLYRQAGKYIALNSHVLLALWDGSPAKPDGCGTAEAVGFMLGRSLELGFRCFQTKNDGAVIHILTPRNSSDRNLAISVKLVENEPGCLNEILRKTDAFNEEAEAKNG